MRGLHGKRIIVAGAAGGIGEGTARRLADEGATLVLGDINVPGAAKVAESIASAGGKAMAKGFDLGDAGSIEALVRDSAAELGGLDGIANVAAALSPAVLGKDVGVIDMDPEIWEVTLRANLTGFALLAKHALPVMIEGGGGSIVNVTSGGAWAGEPLRAAYASSKAGINALTRHLARTYGEHKVRANAVAPGFVVAPSNDVVAPELKEMARSAQSLKAIGAPADLAATIAFLLSDDGAWITGQVWNVDGGSNFRE